MTSAEKHVREPLTAGVARAQRVLADTPLPWDSALQHLADTLVPAVADTLILAVDDGAGFLQHIAVATVDDERTAAVWELAQRYPLPVDSPLSIAAVHRTGVSRIMRGGLEGEAAPLPLPESMEGVAQDVIPAVAALVPLRVRGRSLGVLGLGYDDPASLDESALPLIEELAVAVAVAVDNAQLYRTAQEALAESHDLLAQLDTVLAGAPIGIGVYDRALRFIRCNPALAEINGTTVEESIGRTLDEIVPDAAPLVSPIMREVLDTGEPIIRLDVTVATPASPDEEREFEVSYIPVFDARGGTAAVAATVLEVTAQRRATEALAARVRQQEALAGLSGAGLEGTDLDVLFDRTVGAIADVLSVPMVSVLELLPAGDRLRMRAARGWAAYEDTIPAREHSHSGYALLHGGTVVVEDFATETRFSEAPVGSSVQICSGVAVPISGRLLPFGVIAVHVDSRRHFTDDEVAFLESAAAVLQGAIARDDAERQLARSQKLEAVGRLAGGLAHDFNNLLTVVTVNAELIERHPDHPRFDQAMSEIRDATGRAAQLARQILTFSRGARPPAETTDLSETLRELRNLLVPLLRSDVVLDLEVDEAEALTVRMGSGQLEQVVVNLAINARDAMPAGGRLVITGDLVDAPDLADLPPRDAHAPYVRLRVIDEGHGMDADTRSRALDPFFSTKGEEQGTGLGLSTSWALVRAAGGDIMIDSEIGVGTTVTVYLPAAWSTSEDGEAPREADRAPEVASRRAQVLVVEDQPSIRTLVCQTLAANGYETSGVADGEAAIAVEERPDLILTDLVMPGMSGDDVVRSLRTRWPDLPALYMSGFAGGPPEAPDLPKGRFLAKPFGLRELLDAVAAALADA